MWPFKPKQTNPVNPPVNFKVIERESTTMRLHEFRSDPVLCKGVASALRGAYMKLAMDVLHTESPSNYGLPANASIEVRACYQARIEGYTQAIANLEAMAVHQELMKPLEASFEEPEELEVPVKKRK